MVFLGFLIIPTLLAFYMLVFNHTKIKLREFIAQIVIQSIVALISAGIVGAINVSDTKISNSRISKKVKEKVSCEHSYQCNCITTCSGAGKSRSCTTICQTCYHHPNDWNWVLYTTKKDKIKISRIDSQGKKEPPRYTSAVIGEPASVGFTYENYIKAAPDTLFQHQGLVEKYNLLLPKYPNNIYDYHRLDRFIVIGGVVEDNKEWAKQLSEINADIGMSKNANAIIVAVNSMPRDYSKALAQHWVGGKENDVIVVISGISTIEWVDVFSWSTSELLKIKIRDDILAGGTFDKNTILPIIKNHIENFYIYRQMSDFEYLKNTTTPTIWQWFFGLAFGIMISIGLSAIFYYNDPFA